MPQLYDNVEKQKVDVSKKQSDAVVRVGAWLLNYQMIRVGFIDQKVGEKIMVHLAAISEDTMRRFNSIVFDNCSDENLDFLSISDDYYDTHDHKAHILAMLALLIVCLESDVPNDFRAEYLIDEVFQSMVNYFQGIGPMVENWLITMKHDARVNDANSFFIVQFRQVLSETLKTCIADVLGQQNIVSRVKELKLR